MRRTGAAALIGVAVVGAAAGWLLQVGLTTSGAPSFIPPVTIVAVLLFVALGLLLLGRPVRRLVRGTAQRRVDPFFATRVLMLAKASSITGALLTGAAAALLGWSVTRAASVQTQAFWPDVLLGIGAVALGAAGLVVEWWCSVPPDDRGTKPLDRAEEQR